ncbi:MAG: ribosome biogenesis GTP-binding protein YihA/YsxC [Clostridiales Family XIII bacterium]|jgi:GTP-binding protein|nr:ribosome biogenesis GTP-binding protein YihA/YsxC [Clostridiales Family XIII bacterium]
MKIKNADLLAIAVKPNGYPVGNAPEIAFSGRSNVGKSSLLNLITMRKKLARGSGNTGKTRTLNFFSVNNDTFRIVDLPGYGYAKLSKSVSASWGDMIEEYLTTREQLKGVALLVDIRHKPSAQDVQMYEFLKYHGLNGIIVATKADKVSRNELFKQKKLIRDTLGASIDDKIIPVSSLKKTGLDELYKALGETLFGEDNKSNNDNDIVEE